MRPGRPTLRFLLLTDDTGSGWRGLEELIRRLLGRLEPGAIDQICAPATFVPPTKAARDAMGFHAWASNKAKNHATRVNLARAIATHLVGAEGAEPFVFLLVEADQRRTEDEQPEKLRQFHSRLLPAISMTLQNASCGDRLGRLFLLVPYYHLESWLYLNLAELERWYARRHPSGHPEIEILRRWKQAPESLEDELNPKELLRSIGSSHNLELAQHQYPLKAALQWSRSLAEAHEMLQNSAPLRAALQARTRWPTGAPLE